MFFRGFIWIVSILLCENEAATACGKGVAEPGGTPMFCHTFYQHSIR